MSLRILAHSLQAAGKPWAMRRGRGYSPANPEENQEAAMKLYMHPVSMTSRPVRLFIAEHDIAGRGSRSSTS